MPEILIPISFLLFFVGAIMLLGGARIPKAKPKVKVQSAGEKVVVTDAQGHSRKAILLDDPKQDEKKKKASFWKVRQP